MQLNKEFKPRNVLIFLLVISFSLFLLDYLLRYLGYEYRLLYTWKNYKHVYNIFSLFIETSIPTLFSTLNLLFSSILLWVIAKYTKVTGDKRRYHWLFLSILFLFLALDEGAQIHETIGVSISSFFNFSVGHPLYYVWVIPYTALVLIVGLIYLKFLFTLPRGIRNGIIVAGMLFLIGALGLEIVESMEYKGVPSVAYAKKKMFDKVYIIATVQELMEMVGISIFNYSLLKYIALEQIKIEFSSKEDA